MAKKRKLQVFISSTFTDLIEERQAAVEAILTTGHIPAGMELFTGENEEQMNIINRWIEESDIYMLLLGGRYGSVDPASGKSYTHLEFEYAQSLGKPIFVVVASDAYNKRKVKSAREPGDVVELSHPVEYKKFKDDVVSRYAKFWDSQDRLKLAIINTLHALEKDNNLVGWVPGSEATDTGPIAEQIARLSKENDELRQQLITSQANNDPIRYDGLTYDQMYTYINNIPLLDNFDQKHIRFLEIIASVFGDEKASMLHAFYSLELGATDEYRISDLSADFRYVVNKLAQVGLLLVIPDTTRNRLVGIEGGPSKYKLTNTGHLFMLRIKVEKDISKLPQLLGDLFDSEDRA